MGHYLLKDAPKTGTGDLLISVQVIEPIKMPPISKRENDVFTNALKEIISGCFANSNEINCKIFDLYNLSHEERRYIEGNFN